MIFFDIAVILFCGILDRVRGDDELGLPSKTLDALVYGVCVGYLAYGFSIDALILAPFLAAAMAISYGDPWGAIVGKRDMPEGSWRDFAIRDKHTGLSARAIVGAGVIGLSWFFIPTNPAPALGVFCGFMIAPYLSVYLIDKGLVSDRILNRFNIGKPFKERWNFAEVLRGLIVATVTWLL